MRKKILFAVSLAVFAAGPAFAAPTEKKKDLGTFGAWRSFAYEEGGQTVCYMVTTKVGKTTPKAKGRTSYLMITHRPVEGSTDIFSYGAGKELDSQHGAELRIGKELFDLFSVKENAWARDPMTDHKIAVAIRSTSSAQVSSIPAQSYAKALVDKFTLTGAPSAYQAIGKACGLPGMEAKKPAVKKATGEMAKKPSDKKTAAKKAGGAKSSAANKKPPLKTKSTR